MSEFNPADAINFNDAATVVQYLQICRGVLDKLSTAEAVSRFLDEVSARIGEFDDDLAQFTRTQRDRLSVNSVWIEDESLLKDVKVELINRLGEEERARFSQVVPPSKVRTAKITMFIIGFVLLAGLGAAIWGALVLLSVSSRNGLIAGATVAVIAFALYVRAINRAMGQMLNRSED